MIEQPAAQICAIPGCDRHASESSVDGYCSPHYRIVWRFDLWLSMSFDADRAALERARQE